jgi:hypothetical protein
VAQEDLGIAAASERLTGQIGVALGITLLVTVYDEKIAGFPPAFLLGAAFALAGVVAALRMQRGRVQAHGSIVELALEEAAREETGGTVPVPLPDEGPPAGRDDAGEPLAR